MWLVLKEPSDLVELAARHGIYDLVVSDIAHSGDVLLASAVHPHKFRFIQPDNRGDVKAFMVSGK